MQKRKKSSKKVGDLNAQMYVVKDFIDEFIKRWTDVTNVTISDQTIRITGDNAIVRHRLVADSKKAGYPPVIDIIVLMVWRKENGRWKMLARQAAKIPGK